MHAVRVLSQRVLHPDLRRRVDWPLASVWIVALHVALVRIPLAVRQYVAVRFKRLDVCVVPVLCVFIAYRLPHFLCPRVCATLANV